MPPGQDNEKHAVEDLQSHYGDGNVGTLAETSILLKIDKVHTLWLYGPWSVNLVDVQQHLLFSQRPHIYFSEEHAAAGLHGCGGVLVGVAGAGVGSPEHHEGTSNN